MVKSPLSDLFNCLKTYRVLHIDPDALFLVLSRLLTMMHSPNIIPDPKCLIFRLSNEVSFVVEFYSEDG